MTLLGTLEISDQWSRLEVEINPASIAWVSVLSNIDRPIWFRWEFQETFSIPFLAPAEQIALPVPKQAAITYLWLKGTEQITDWEIEVSSIDLIDPVSTLQSIIQGPPGEAGPQGLQGPTGPQGEPGLQGPGAYSSISAGTINTPTASIQITNIPQVHDEIIIELWARIVNATLTNTELFLNGDTTHSNYHTQRAAQANGSSFNGEFAAAAPGICASGGAPGGYYLYNLYSIPRYSELGLNKIINARITGPVDLDNLWDGMATVIWKSSTAAINSLLLTAGAQTFATGTTYKVWGKSWE
jgi:hypothetical protein